MTAYYYTKRKNIPIKILMRIASMVVCIVGVVVLLYTFFPLVSWQLYFTQALAYQDIESPIPKTSILNPEALRDLFSRTQTVFDTTDYTNAQNWFPNYKLQEHSARKETVPFYTLSIPSLDINHAVVSTQDTDLAIHLVNYPGTAIPPDKGTSIVFGHSTLPQLFNPSDYKTIFARLYKLKVGNEILAHLGTVSYTYIIYSITVVDPTDTSVLAQQYDGSYLTLITCTPPGTTWKRLVLKARLIPI